MNAGALNNIKSLVEYVENASHPGEAGRMLNRAVAEEAGYTLLLASPTQQIRNYHERWSLIDPQGNVIGKGGEERDVQTQYLPDFAHDSRACQKLAKPAGYFWRITEAMEEDEGNEGVFNSVGWFTTIEYADDSSPLYATDWHGDARTIEGSMILAWAEMRYALSNSTSA